MKTMRSIFMMLALIAAGSCAQAQDGEKTVKQDRNVGEFTSITLDYPVKYTIKQGDVSMVTVEAPEDIQDKISPKVTENGLSFDFKAGDFDKIKILITARTPESIKIAGPANLKSEGTIKGNKITIRAEGASEVELDLDVEELSSTLSGASDVILTGRAGQHQARVGGAANLKAIDLQTLKTEIDAGGAAYVSVDATEELKGEVGGAANLAYKSKPPLYSVEETGAASSDEADTTKIKLGDKRVFIFDDRHDHMKKFPRHGKHATIKRKSNIDFKLIGIDFGLNGYVNPDFKFDVPPGRSYLELDYGRSFGAALDMFHVGIPIDKKHVRLWIGPGFEFNNYAFRTDYLLTMDTSTIAAQIDPGVAYDRNKLTVVWFRVPLIMTFNFNKFNFSLGVIGAIRTNSYTKHTWEENGTKMKTIAKDDYHINPFKADATFRIGVSGFNLFANYTFTDMFRNGHGPRLNPFSAGLAFNILTGK